MIASPPTPTPSAPRPAPSRPAPATAAVLALGLALVGVGHHHAPAAWLGVAVVAGAFAVARHVGWTSLGLAIGGIAGLLVAHPWQPTYVAAFMPGHGPLVVGLVTALTAAFMTLVTKGPLLAAWLAGRRWNQSAMLWLPLGWAAGEGLLGALTGVTHHDWLYSQWQVGSVLRAVGQLGWTPALLLCLAIAAALGEGIVAPVARRISLGAALAAGLALLPPLAAPDPHAFDGVSAVHFGSDAGMPRRAPAGTRWLIWPELASTQHPWLGEGHHPGRTMAPPLPHSAPAHLLGVAPAGPGGERNALVSLSPEGAVEGVRAKRLLFPFSERPVLGVSLPRLRPFRPGSASVVMTVGGRRIGALICLEALDRGLVDEARRGGATLLAICSSDFAMGPSPVAARQMLAIATLRAVESRLPVVRAARTGPAALIQPDGTLVASSAPGTDGVLTAAADVPPLGPVPSAGQVVPVAVLVSAESPALGADVSADRCAYFEASHVAAPGVKARTVIVAGHSQPPAYLGLSAERLAEAIAAFSPELVVLDTCFGASTPILRALTARGLRCMVVAAPFRTPVEGFAYGPAFWTSADPAARARAIATRPSYPLLTWRLDPAGLDRLESSVRRMGPAELRRRLSQLSPPLVRADIAPGAPALALVPVERFKAR